MERDWAELSTLTATTATVSSIYHDTINMHNETHGIVDIPFPGPHAKPMARIAITFLVREISGNFKI